MTPPLGRFTKRPTTAPTTLRWARLLPGRDGRRPALLDVFMRYVGTFLIHQRHPAASASSLPGAKAARHSATVAAYAPRPAAYSPLRLSPSPRRCFHNYFVTHLPSSSMHPDPRLMGGPHHKLPRDASIPHIPGPGGKVPAATPPNMPATSGDLAVVRIPLRSAKHHLGVFESRGQRPYNEDTNQSGTIDIPAFAKRAPVSLVRRPAVPSPTAGAAGPGTAMSTAGSSTTISAGALGDPQVFYFAVFDGHGGAECSDFLRDELHGYIEEAAAEFQLQSSLDKKDRRGWEAQPWPQWASRGPAGPSACPGSSSPAKLALDQLDMKSGADVKDELRVPRVGDEKRVARMDPLQGQDPVPAAGDSVSRALRLQKELMEEYKNAIGGYWRRFIPTHFSVPSPYKSVYSSAPSPAASPVTVESVLTYAFLRADLDFITAQARKPDRDDPHVADFPLNQDEILGKPHLPPSGHGIGGSARFKGGSTASVALISTPTPAPYWHPAARSSLIVAHVGDTCVLLCETSTGLPRPLTSDHHPSTPSEAQRLRRNPGGIRSVQDSFGEERIAGLANSRAFGDMTSKRVGVTAEPDVVRVDLGPAQYSFAVLCSDGVSGTLGDQEIVDVVKEAATPEGGARAVVDYATEVSRDGDNATCLVVRLGGWERRSEGGLGSLGTKEMRDARRAEALDPRRRRAG